jgi:hypothetical protein
VEQLEGRIRETCVGCRFLTIPEKEGARNEYYKESGGGSVDIHSNGRAFL